MRKKLWRCLALVLALASLLTAPACAAELPGQPETVRADGLLYVPDHSVYFADVAADYNWAFQEIDYLANTNVVSGTGNFIFSPAKSLTRADFILMLYRAYDMEKYVGEGNFSDVSPNAYYADALCAARALGIATGDAQDRFYPTKELTRQDAMVFLKRTLDRTGLTFPAGDLSVFSDRDQLAAYASEAVGALTQAGVIGGTNGKLAPTRAVTRAEMAIMLYRALHLQNSAEGPRYVARPDVRMVCVGSTLYADVKIVDYDPNRTYAGLFTLVKLTNGKDGYAVTLGEPVAADDTVVWDGGTLTVNGEVIPVAANCEAIELEPYAKRSAGLCSTGTDYASAAVSVVDGTAQTVYYQKK